MLLRLLILSFMLTSCRTGSDNSDLDTVFNKDDRRPWTELDPVLRASVGLLYRGNTICTATLITTKHILTNAHCVVDNDGNKKTGRFCFYLDYMQSGKKTFALAEEPEGFLGADSRKRRDCNRRSQTISYKDSAEGTPIPMDLKRIDKNYQSDWAIIELDKPLGQQYGYLDILELPVAELKGLPVMSPGFSSDFKQQYGQGSFQPNCRIEYTDSKYIRHSCDTTTGASGTPLIHQRDGKYYIVALHSSSESDDCAFWEKEDGRCKNGVNYRDKIANKAIFPKEFLPEVNTLKALTGRN